MARSLKAFTAARLVAVTLAMAEILPARAAGSAFQIGSDGWQLETFGTDVAILRAPLSSERPAGAQVGVLLSCSGTDRRIRLSFPAPIIGAPSRAGVGSALFTQTGRRDGGMMVATHFSLSDASTMVVSAPVSSRLDAVRTISQMLLAKSAGLDVLFYVGQGPVAFTHLLTYRLFLSVGEMDVVSVNRFLDACDRAMARDAG